MISYQIQVEDGDKFYALSVYSILFQLFWAVGRQIREVAGIWWAYMQQGALSEIGLLLADEGRCACLFVWWQARATKQGRVGASCQIFSVLQAPAHITFRRSLYYSHFLSHYLQYNTLLTTAASHTIYFCPYCKCSQPCLSSKVIFLNTTPPHRFIRVLPVNFPLFLLLHAFFFHCFPKSHPLRLDRFIFIHHASHQRISRITPN